MFIPIENKTSLLLTKVCNALLDFYNPSEDEGAARSKNIRAFRHELSTNEDTDGSRISHASYNQFLAVFQKITSEIASNKINPALAQTPLSVEELEYLEYFLLCSLRDSFPADKEPPAVKENYYYELFKLFCVGVSGIFLFACEGFDGITAILSLFALSTSILLVSGFIFSMLSVAVFFAFNFLEASKHMGVRVKNTPVFLDILREEMTCLEAINRRFQNQLSEECHTLTAEDINEIIASLEILEAKNSSLEKKFTSLQRSLDNPILKMLKRSIAIVTGIIFFSSGFFTGQAVAVALGSLFLISISPTAWPIITVSLLVGFAALTLYWNVERPRIEILVGKLVGFNQEKLRVEPQFFQAVKDDVSHSKRDARNYLVLKANAAADPAASAPECSPNS